MIIKITFACFSELRVNLCTRNLVDTAQGRVEEAALKFNKKEGHTESVKEFADELFWRDFFKYFFVRYGNLPFRKYGVPNRSE